MIDLSLGGFEGAGWECHGEIDVLRRDFHFDSRIVRGGKANAGCGIVPIEHFAVVRIGSRALSFRGRQGDLVGEVYSDFDNVGLLAVMS